MKKSWYTIGGIILVFVSSVIIYSYYKNVYNFNILNSKNYHHISRQDIISNIKTIQHFSHKGRVQDKDYNSDLEIFVNQIIGDWENAIPELISLLDNDLVYGKNPLCFWHDTTIGDTAYVVLNDLFLDPSFQKVSIPDLQYKEFFKEVYNAEYPNDTRGMRYMLIEKHGRKFIKEKWEKIWDTYKSNVYWDEENRYFIPKDQKK